MNKNDIRTRLFLGNERFLNNDSNLKKDTELMHDLAENGQHPFAVVIACSDSRVNVEMMFDEPLGNIFVIRSAGNIIGEMELASFEYAIAHLGVKYALILGHTHCGAIHSTIHDEPHGYIKNITDHIAHNILDEQDELEATIKNVNEEAKHLKSLLNKYDFEIDKAIYNIETGKVSFID